MSHKLTTPNSDDDCIVTHIIPSKPKDITNVETQKKRDSSPRRHKMAASETKSHSKITETEQRKRRSTDPPDKEPPKRRKLESSSYKGPRQPGANESWEIVDELASRFRVPLDVSFNITRMLDDENTIPFIARYRKEKTGNMEADKLRDFDDQYEVLKSVKEKAAKVIKTIEKSGNADPTLFRAVNSARSMEDLETINEPFKLSKTSLAQKAKQLGLEKPSLTILKDLSMDRVRLDSYVDPRKKGISTLAEVEVGVKHIIAEHIAKDYDIIKSVKETFPPSVLFIEAKENRNLKKKLSEMSKRSKEDDVYKFENYFDFKKTIDVVQPHQVLALNRGENLKILSVKIDIPHRYVQRFQSDAYRHISRAKSRSQYVDSLLNSSIQDSYNRLTEPSVTRRARSDLTKKAERSSVEVFAKNLRNLLLTAPVRGKTILAIDPGFRQGCKVAVVAPNGNPLFTRTLYLHDSNSASRDRHELVDVARKHKCEIIAIGNGTACRETEELIASLIKRQSFQPLKASYCIVNESGASVYSVSEEAVAEFPDMDPNLRSAVSLARRLIDPLSEYVKVDPKHLGIGMYQHDISETLLRKSLDGVIQECVSFVGVDVNTASQTLISKVAGLTETKAKKIVKFRQENGAIVNREQILLVPSIGAKTYVQCAGFLRISPKTLQSCLDSRAAVTTAPSEKPSKSKSKKAMSVRNPLDSTSIHPEAYDIAKRLITKCGCEVDDVGTLDFIGAITTYFVRNTVEECALEMGAGVPTMKLIADGLSQEVDYDARGEFNKPLFKQGISDLNSLKVGMVLSGKVMNTTTFGVFIDVGVGRSGLIPNSMMNRRVLLGKDLSLGDRVEVKVDSINHERQNFSLWLVSVERSPQAFLS